MTTGRRKWIKQDRGLSVIVDTISARRTVNIGVGIAECAEIIDLKTAGTKTEKEVDLKEEVINLKVETGIQETGENQHPD